MTTSRRMPPAAAYLAAFGGILRRSGFAATPDKTTTFLAALPLLGPGGIEDVHKAALACYGPLPETRPEFDALFREHFCGAALSAANAEAEDETLAESETPASQRAEGEQTGEVASLRERLQERSFREEAAEDALKRLDVLLPDRLPRRKAFRQHASSRGRTIDLRRSLRQITRNGGDAPHPQMTIRSAKPRNILILIDVSGSMKSATDAYLRLAHTVVQRAPGAEVFTFATRLSRITPALKLRSVDAALAAASARVADWDGGTRIGPCLADFLSVARYASFARGAAVLVVSDGIERGDVSAFTKAVRRLSSLAWRLSWATPLASDPGFEPRTRAMRAVLSVLDDLIDGSAVAGLADFLLTLTKPGPRPSDIWTPEGRPRRGGSDKGRSSN